MRCEMSENFDLQESGAFRGWFGGFYYGPIAPDCGPDEKVMRVDLSHHAQDAVWRIHKKGTIPSIDNRNRHDKDGLE